MYSSSGSRCKNNVTKEIATNILNKWIEKYDGLVEKTKDYFHAIKLAPQQVADFFKTIFDKEKQDELERQRIEQEK